MVKTGDRLHFGLGCGSIIDIDKAIARRADELKDITVISTVAIREKPFETYLATNNFPAPIPTETTAPQPQVQQQFTPQPTPQVTPQPIYSTAPAQPSVEPLPWETQPQQINRPIRTY